ncbi:MAG: hypothetical protein ABIJ97_16645 [Bacteroidota bacterium]
MKTKGKKLFVTLLLIAMSQAVLLSQSKFEKATSDPASLEKKAFQDWPKERGKNGKGYTVYYPALKEVPKKIALVSFAIHDPGYTKDNANSISTVRTSDGSAEIIVNAYLGVAIEPLKKTFKEYGMELLTPDEFLDTDEKKTSYYDFVLEKRNNGNKGLSNLASGGTHVSLSMAAKGYRELIPREEMVFIEGGQESKFSLLDCKDPKMMEGLGSDLAKALDVDAVLIIYNTVKSKNTYSAAELKYVSMAMFGPNPIELAEGEKDGALYRKGLYYGVFRIEIGESTKDKKDASTFVITKGYENIMVGLANRLGAWLKEKTAEEDK